MKKAILLMSIVLAAARGMVGEAGAAEVRATASVPAKSSFFSSKPKKAEVDAARRAAMREAWKQYTATFTRARLRERLINRAQSET
jgi:hypothetical protein